MNMTKRFLLCLSLVWATVAVLAVPARRGTWRTLRLADGTEVRAQLVGDERGHCWVAEDGTKYAPEGETGRYAPVTRVCPTRKAAPRRTSSGKARVRRSAAQRRTAYRGTKRGLVILAQFSDYAFATGHDIVLYANILNKEGYTDSNGFRGSVRDYFKAQSGGVFDLQFDVVGPVTLSKKQNYYGKNDSRTDDDLHAAEMVIEACKLADAAGTDFSRYDWDGDGEVDQVYVVYAGMGEADGGEAYTIWPHEYDLESAKYYGDGTGPLRLDGVKVNTYACGSELDGSSHIEGIGTFCHEFSHCLGYPDMYDTEYAGNFGMSDFDLMDMGSYNGNGFQPAGYSSYEKWVAGWLTPTVLADEEVTVTDLKPMSEGGEAFVIYNRAHPDEYYLVENRQKTNWDSQLPARGLMVIHVDYNELCWEWNMVNTVIDYEQEYGKDYAGIKNDHQRLTIIHADNNDDSQYWRPKGGYYSRQTLSTDLYPYARRDSLTNESAPAATLYNDNTDGTKLMNIRLTAITQNSDGTMSFRYAPVKEGDGIEDVTDTARAASDGETYDLTGRRVANPARGLYIVGGKKRIFP